jgi:DNA sulfur modification protein DndC
VTRVALPAPRRRPFGAAGLGGTVASLVDEMRQLYLSDNVPWTVGLSGKDSTATLQLVWLALQSLPAQQRTKPVHVISTDTLVENPIVAAWMGRNLAVIAAAAAEQDLPVQVHRLTPKIKDTFWVNLIGRGYAAPRPKFRWCTERLKIRPSNDFIRSVVASHGEAVVVLGMRKQESAARGRVMAAHEAGRVRDRLSPNASLPNSLVYTPIEDWSSDEVWLFLMQVDNPWAFSNKDLLALYQGASADNECPLVVDTTTPSCGTSRFGCWTCTMVTQDKSMTAMIINDADKEWMLPLLELRDALDVDDDRHLRDFRRMNGRVQLFHDRPIPGPYLRTARENWLRRLLQAQQQVRENGPPEFAGLELITLAELDEIRRIWVRDKNEFGDAVPRTWTEVTGLPYPGEPLDGMAPLGEVMSQLIDEVCDGDEVHAQMIRDLLAVEHRHRSQVRRAGLFAELEQAIRRGFYDGEDDAVEYARSRQAREPRRPG